MVAGVMPAIGREIARLLSTLPVAHYNIAKFSAVTYPLGSTPSLTINASSSPIELAKTSGPARMFAMT